jgi:hypothetical protein
MNLERCQQTDDKNEQCRLHSTHRQKCLFHGAVLTKEWAMIITLESALSFHAGKTEGITNLCNELTEALKAKKEGIA